MTKLETMTAKLVTCSVYAKLIQAIYLCKMTIFQKGHNKKIKQYNIYLHISNYLK